MTVNDLAGHGDVGGICDVKGHVFAEQWWLACQAVLINGNQLSPLFVSHYSSSNSCYIYLLVINGDSANKMVKSMQPLSVSSQTSVAFP